MLGDDRASRADGGAVLAVQGGALRAGTKVAVVPSGQSGTVKAAEAGDSAITFACAGDSLDLSLTGVDTGVRKRDLLLFLALGRASGCSFVQTALTS